MSSSDIGSGTAKGLMTFLDGLVDKGRATSGSIAPLKSATRQVLSVVEGENWETLDVRQLDIEDYMLRFGNMTMDRQLPEPTLRSYRSRMTKAVNWYKDFLSKPGWVPPRSAPARTAKGENVPKVGILPSDTKQETQPFEPKYETQPSYEGTDLITYPFPLRPSKIVSLYLPVALTQSEARRLGAFLESISIEDAIQDTRTAVNG
jgi:hypothetical protein